MSGTRAVELQIYSNTYEIDSVNKS